MAQGVFIIRVVYKPGGFVFSGVKKVEPEFPGTGPYISVLVNAKRTDVIVTEAVWVFRVVKEVAEGIGFRMITA